GGPVRGGALRRHRPRDGICGDEHVPRRAWRAPTRAGARARVRRARARLRPPGAPDSGGRAGEPRPARPRRRLDRGRGGLPLALDELLAPRADAEGGRRQDGRGGPRGARRMSGYIALEDGTVLPGRSVAAPGVAFGEAVFTTAMTGYQESVTDPSFAGQLLAFTAPMVGNYGVADTRLESAQPWVKAVLMRRCGGDAWALWLSSHGLVALDGVDTRRLVLRIREAGAMRAAAVASSGELAPDDALELIRQQPSMEGQALVSAVSSVEPRVFNEDGRVRVAVVDYGAKASIMRRLR